MKNLFILFCSFLLNGVFGDTEVKGKEGDSVTLNINPEDIIDATDLVLSFKGTNIAKIDIENKNKPPPVYTEDERFRDRLKLDRQTGSLTITHITHEDSGEYKLEISTKIETKDQTFRVSVIDKMKTVSLMEGDTLTLHVTDGKIDDVKWTFNGDVLTDHDDKRFKNSEVNHQTGDLNIRNIRRDQSGEYEVTINGSSVTLYRTYHVNVSGEVNESFMKGENIILHTNANRIQADDDVQWKFGNTLIAYSHKTTGYVPYDDADGRYTDRLHLDQTGSLIITNFRSEDSGRYEVYITGSKNIHKIFHVTESSQRSNGEKTGPGSFVVLILMGIFMIN